MRKYDANFFNATAVATDATKKNRKLIFVFRPWYPIAIPRKKVPSCHSF